MPEHTIESAQKRLDYLSTLEDGWLDGEGKAISPRSIRRCSEFLRITGVTGFSIFPMPEGHVQLEWIQHDEPAYLSIDFDGDEHDKGDTLWMLPDDYGPASPDSRQDITKEN